VNLNRPSTSKVETDLVERKGVESLDPMSGWRGQLAAV